MHVLLILLFFQRAQDWDDIRLLASATEHAAWKVLEDLPDADISS